VKILCLIDSLGSGGAQRQLATLAVGLKKRGHQVRFLVYHPHDHFLPLLQAAEIPCHVIASCSYSRRVLGIRRILRQGWQDVVLAFLEGPSLYAELACIPKSRWGLVVGERLADPKIMKGLGLRTRHFHCLADAVVSNSHTNRIMLEVTFPFLKKRLSTVYNTVDLKLFRPFSDGIYGSERVDKNTLLITVAASYQEKKNMQNVAKALLCLKGCQAFSPIVVNWFGAMPSDNKAFRQAERFVVENGLSETLRLHPATRDIAAEFSRADAVGLFSFFEGLPNVVCEGMACGKPILLSNVCDAGNLVQDGKNGFMFDPSSPESIAKAFQRLIDLSEMERRQMGAESRRMAERLFSEDVVIERYERILTRAAHHEPTSSDCNWPAEVPESAARSVERWAKGS
jgi:glycosyltransferase involved in cell wall biosynthesis